MTDVRPASSTTDGATEALFRATLDALPDAVLVVDESGVVITANVQVEAVFGYTPAEIEGQLIEVLVPPRARARHPSRRTSYTRRPMGLLQLAAVRRDGVEFPAEISLAPIEAGAATLTAATVRDITPRLLLEAEADRIRDELLATVSHELRTPLTSIVGYAELMADLDADELSPRGRKMLDTIRRNAERELRLVSDLLTVAVTHLGEMPLELTSFTMGELLTTVVADRRGEARARGLDVSLVLPADPPPPVVADRSRILQVVDNLLGNAIKFTPAGGRIQLHLSALEDSLVLRVVDTGEGIEPTELDRIFERMYRGRSAARAERQGAGLGLSIVKSIVEAHRGTVSVESVVGRGTVFTVQLPCRVPRDG